jgi:hypothetical protein
MNMSNDIVQATFDYASLDEDTRIFVKVKAEAIQSRLKRTAEDIIAIGQDLIAVKGRLEHGEFLPWIRSEFEMNYKSAERFIDVANKFGEHSKLDNLSNLSASVLYLLAAPSTPETIVQEVLSGDIKATEDQSLLEAVKEAKRAAVDAVKAKRKAEQEAALAQQQLSIFQEHSQLSQDKISGLTKQIKDLQHQLEIIATPEKVEVTPQSVLDTIEAMKAQITKLIEHKQLLLEETKKFSEELKAERAANEAVRNQERYEAQVKDKWRKATEALYQSLKQFIGQMPSSIDLQIFDAEEWARHAQIEDAIKDFMEIFLKMKEAKYSQIVDSVYEG